MMRGAENDPIGMRHIAFDKAWHEIGKPYYDVYPSIIPMLTKLNLTFPGTSIIPPNGIRHLLLRLPIGQHDLCTDDITVRCVFLSFQRVNRSPGSNQPEQGLAVALDIGETAEELLPIFTMRIFPLDERAIEESIFALNTHESTFTGINVPDELIIRTVRLALTVCLINDNPEFIERQALSRDETKFNLASDDEKQKLFDRARRRGKYGFSLGKYIEMIPHIRRPHPCLVWTGKGKQVARIVLRKGSFIHKNKIEQVPTGYDINEE